MSPFFMFPSHDIGWFLVYKIASHQLHPWIRSKKRSCCWINMHFHRVLFFKGAGWSEVKCMVHGWEIKATALNHALWHLSNVQAVHVCDGDSDCVLHTPVVLEMKATFIGKDDSLWKASCDETVQDVKNSTPLTDQACFELVNCTKVWHAESSVHRQFDHLCSRAIDPSAFDCGARSHRNT